MFGQLTQGLSWESAARMLRPVKKTATPAVAIPTLMPTAFQEMVTFDQPLFATILNVTRTVLAALLPLSARRVR
jgi:hypothetical protein